MKNKNILLGLLLLIIIVLLVWYFGFRPTSTSEKLKQADNTDQPAVKAQPASTGPSFNINTVTGADGKKQDITTFFAARDSAVILPGGINTLPALKVVDHETDGDQLYFQLPMAKFNNNNITFVMDESKTINASMKEENSANPGIMLISNSVEVLESLKKAKNIKIIVDIQSVGKKSLFFIANAQ